MRRHTAPISPPVPASSSPALPPCRSTYDDQLLQLFTSSFFLAGMVVSPFAAPAIRHFGRKWMMMLASLLFLAGAGLNAGAQNLAMLVVGRVLLGFGVGFANNAVPLYLSETAPPRFRGGLNMLFQASRSAARAVLPWGGRQARAPTGPACCPAGPFVACLPACLQPGAAPAKANPCRHCG